MNPEKIEPITIKKAKEILLQTMRLYFSKNRKGEYQMDRRRTRPLYLMGAAGIGKTEIVRQAAEESGVAFLSYSVTHHTRQSLIGLPCLKEEWIGGELVSMTEYTMSEILAEIYQTIEETGKAEGVLLLDECNCISESLRPIMLQLLQEKVFGRHSIPDGWLLVLTGNPAEYHRGAMEMDAVTADRVRLLWIEPDYGVWKEYMKEKGLDQGILSYLDSHRKHFYSKREGLRGRYIVTPRAWEDLSVMLHEMQKRGIPVTYPLIVQYISDGRIADSFFTYYCQRERACTSERIRRILRGEENTGDKLNRLSFEAQLSVILAVLQELRTLAEEAVKRKETAEVVSIALRRIRLACEEGECSFSEGLRDVVQEEEDQAAKAYLMKNWRWLQENEDDWALLQETFFTDIKTPAEAAKEAFASSMQGSISVLLKEIEQDSLLQCFFHELAEEDMIMETSLHCEIPAMRALFSRVSFSFEEESEMLLQEVKEEKRRNRREAVKRRQEEKASSAVEA